MPGYTPNVTATGPVINGKATGSTKIFTVENGTQRFIPTSIHLETITYTAAPLINTQPTISIGTNAPNYDNILGAADLASILANLFTIVGVVKSKNVTDSNAIASIAPGTDIYCRVSVATSSNAYTFRVDTQGYYV